MAKKSFADARISITNLASGRAVRSKGRAKVYVDSGATITILHERSMPALEQTGPLKKRDVEFSTANGVKKATQVDGVSVCVDKVCYKGSVVVTDQIEGELMIGTDFLESKKCKLDFEHKTLECGGRNIPFNLE